MARPARPWFRFYVEAMRDPKMRRLTPAERWLWVAILSAARESCEPGYLLVAVGIPMTCDDLADYAGMPLKDVDNGVAKMLELGMMQRDCNGETLFLPSWNDRQYESDNSTERSRKSRHSDVLATSLSVSVSDSVSVSLEKEQFAEFWSVYPRRDDKKRAEAAFAKAVQRASSGDIFRRAMAYRDDPNRDEAFTKQAASWLNGDCWNDPPLPPRHSPSRNPNATRDRIAARFVEVGNPYPSPQIERGA